MASETKKRKRASRAKAKAKQTRLQRAGHTTFVPDTEFSSMSILWVMSIFVVAARQRI
nr:hypothetical protein [Pseudomonas amygdali]